MDQDVSAVSSTATEVPHVSAVEQAVSSRDQAAFKEARRAEREGKPLEPTKPADTASAQPGDQAASTDASSQPASEPGKGKDKGAKARATEISAEVRELQEQLRLRKALREELAQLDKGDTPAATPAASVDRPSKLDIARYKQMPDYPKADEYEDYDDLVTARAAFVAEQKALEIRTEQQQARQSDAMQQSITSMQKKGREAFSDFDDVVTAAADAGVVFPPHVLNEVFGNETHGHVIARELAIKATADPAFRAQLADPVKTGIAIGQILASQQTSAKSSPSPVPKAPEPPVLLGSKTSDVGDPLDAAVKAGDMAAFKAAKHAERVANMRR